MGEFLQSVVKITNTVASSKLRDIFYICASSQFVFQIKDLWQKDNVQLTAISIQKLEILF